jgi:uncharacterized SAM-binding protein YcdF (DUF218 family)
MYLLKQLVTNFASPLPVALLLIVLAVIFRATGRSRATIVCVVAALCWCYVTSIVPVGNALLQPLESRHAPIDESRGMPEVDYIVVLGSGYSPRAGLPVTSALDSEGLVRIVEGVRLWHKLPHSKLIVSGGAHPGRVAPAIGYARLARELSVPEASIQVLGGSLDTGDEASNIAALLGDARFLLVTSAFHMPRAMQLMEQAGARPIAAPAGHRGGRPFSGDWRDWVPASTGLNKTERALHEYLGSVAAAAGIN